MSNRIVRRSILAFTIVSGIAVTADASAVYTVKDLGIATYQYEDTINAGGHKIYVTNSDEIGHGTQPSQAPYTFGYTHVGNNEIINVTPDGGSPIPIQPPGYIAASNVIANGVNSSGLVVGGTQGETAAVYYQVGWAPGETAKFLPRLDHLAPNPTTFPQINIHNNYVGLSNAFGVNSQGDIVGQIATDINHAFLFTGGHMIDLNSLIDPNSSLMLSSAVSINDSGYIAGYALDTAGIYHEYELIPNATPEPSTLALLVVGISVFGFRSVHRRRR